MKHNGTAPTSTGSHHWLELLPGFVYCFVPSLHDCAGVIKVYNSKPEFIRDFEYSMKIEKVFIIIIIFYISILRIRYRYAHMI